MTAQEALIMVDQICAQVPLKRDVSIQVNAAINTLQEAISPKTSDEVEETPQD